MQNMQRGKPGVGIWPNLPWTTSLITLPQLGCILGHSWTGHTFLRDQTKWGMVSSQQDSVQMLGENIGGLILCSKRNKPELRYCFMTKYLISTCFNLGPEPSRPLAGMAAMLSTFSTKGCLRGTWSAVTSWENQQSSLLAHTDVINSASQDDWAMTVCFLDTHVMAPLFDRRTCPDWDLQSEASE